MVDVYLNTNTNKVKNHAGGLVFKTSNMEQLERFLILGTESGTFYVDSQNHTFDNAKNLNKVLDEEGVKAVQKIVEIGKSGRAPKHEPALYALAVAASHSNLEVRKYALDNMNEVVRTGTHLFHFIAYAHTMRGWGRAFRRALNNWYLDKDAKSLALQVMKYKQRDGWSHRDVLRVAHPKTDNMEIDAIFKYVTQGEFFNLGGEAHDWMEAAIRAGETESIPELVKMIEEYRLPREVLPTSALKDKNIWMAMLPHMGYHAMLRNIRNMIKYEVIEQGGEGTKMIIDRLSNGEALRRSRVHPADVFKALKAIGWNDGHPYSYSGWYHNPDEVTAPQGLIRTLEDAFYASFENVEATGKSILTALDVSGSMSIEVGKGLGSAAEWSALMAMVTARSEINAEFFAFSNTFVEFPLTGRESISGVLDKMGRINFGRTNTALPMEWAKNNRRNYDAFFVYTDNETWDRSHYWGRDKQSSGSTAQALREYRQWKGDDNVALGVVGMTSTGFTIGDPSDQKTLSVVGMDSSVPAVLSNFIR